MEFLNASGITPHAVSVKVLVPLLDGASLEDEENEEMIDRWAALLAHAAAGAPVEMVLPSFPRILAELSPAEAVLLDSLYRDATSRDVRPIQVFPGAWAHYRVPREAGRVGGQPPRVLPPHCHPSAEPDRVPERNKIYLVAATPTGYAAGVRRTAGPTRGTSAASIAAYSTASTLFGLR